MQLFHNIREVQTIENLQLIEYNLIGMFNL